MEEIGTEFTVAEHAHAVRNHKWLVLGLAVLGAVPGILSGLSSGGVTTQVRLRIPTICTDGEVDSSVGTFSCEIAIELPDMPNDTRMLVGDFGTHLTFDIRGVSEQRAIEMAAEIASEYVADARAVFESQIQTHLDSDLATIAELRDRLDALPAGQESDRVVVLSNLLLYERRVVEYSTLVAGSAVYGDPTQAGSPVRSTSIGWIALAAAGSIFGALIAAAIAIARRVFDRRMRTRADLERTVLGVPVLAVLPRGQLPAGSFVLSAATVVHSMGSAGSRVVAVAAPVRAASVPAIVDGLRTGFQVFVDSKGDAAAGNTEVFGVPEALDDDAGGYALATRSDGVVLVVEAGTTSDRQLVGTVRSLAALGGRIVGLVLTEVPPRELKFASTGAATTGEV